MTDHEWQASIGTATNKADAENSRLGKVALAVTTWPTKTVLLVDVNSQTRDSRAKVLRARGVTVHCASGASTAMSRLAGAKYNLVLVDLGSDHRGAEALVEEIKSNNPRQRVAFLVGSPLYLASSLKGDRTPPQPARSEVAEHPVTPVLPAVPETSDFGKRIKQAEAEAGL